MQIDLRKVLKADAIQFRIEKMLLFSIIIAYTRRHCLEIGSCRGGSAEIIYRALEAQEGKGTLLCMDPNHQCPQKLRDEMKERVTFVTGFSPKDNEKLFGDRMFDLVFIDGNHSYEAVIADCRGIEPFLLHKALIVFHDAKMDSVKKAIDQWVAEQPLCYDMGWLDLGEKGSIAMGYRMVRWHGEYNSVPIMLT